ncbi:MAG: acyl--CoA ligase [Oligoflexia bacterium]|nr:acyl--CoA ligase [Oligoflexia bacterium]
MLLGQKLAMTVNSNSSRPMFRYLAKSQTYKEAYSYINRYSYFLQNEIMHNKKVLVYMSNCPHLAYTFFALANTKNIAIIVDPNTPDPKVVDKIKDMAIDVIIVSDDYLQRMKDMCKNNNIMIPIIQCEARRWGEYDNTYRLPPGMSAADNDVVAIFETKGTSGKPKLVPWTHDMIQQACLVLRSAYRAGPTDTFFVYGASLSDPFYFLHGMLFPLIHGSGILITDITSPEDLFKELMEGKASRVLMRGSQIEEWFNSFKAINVKLPLVRSIIAQCSPMRPGLDEYIQTEFNCKIHRLYGSVESCWAVAARQFEEPEPFDSVGQFLPGIKTRIIDENGDDIPGNKPQIGQLILSGKTVCTAYVDNKEATKMNMRGAWFFTGDFVSQDKQGVVRFLDRKDNIFRVGPNWIIPPMIESKLSQMPGVDKVVIIETKDGIGKSQVTAIIVKKAGVEVSSQDVQTYAAQNLPEHERPKAVAFFPELPLDGHGQINKYKIRSEFN